MTEAWTAEHRNFAARSCPGVDYVYLWADGIKVNISVEEHKPCLLVLIGVRAHGRRDPSRAAAGGLADRLPESSRIMTSSVRKTTRFARYGGTALVAVGLVQSHIRALSTSISQPGADGSKPCSTSQWTRRGRRRCRTRRMTDDVAGFIARG
ncbi:hypothetical protein ACQPWY_05490 [Pseudonocardia xinjiangensis]|uniref:hypothetical protein n=1 Tax=Pseudonocardia xinjiangensis TaxID=75289 RepID=UPI003D8B5AC4